MKRPFFFHFHQGKTSLSLISLILFFLLLSLGCRGGGDTPAENGEPASEQKANLVCTEECAARAQCGKVLSTGEIVILGNRDFPAVENHQMSFRAAETFAIAGVQDQIVQVVATGEQFNQPFYLIKRSDEQAGWVANWCVEPQ